MKKNNKSLKTSKPKEDKVGKIKKNKKNGGVNSKEEKKISINKPAGKENERLDKDIFDVLGFS